MLVCENVMWVELWVIWSYEMYNFPLEVSLTSLVSVMIIYSQVCSCLIIIHCSLGTNDLTDIGAITLARALQDNKSLEDLKWVVWCSEENCQCCMVRLPYFTMISYTRANHSYILIVLLRGPFTTCTNSGVHLLSFIVLKEIKLESLEPLHWLILWEWTRAWKHWSESQDLKGKGYKHMWSFFVPNVVQQVVLLW